MSNSLSLPQELFLNHPSTLCNNPYISRVLYASPGSQKLRIIGALQGRNMSGARSIMPCNPLSLSQISLVKLKHVNIKFYWLWDQETQNHTKLIHIAGTKNPADNFIKLLPCPADEENVILLGKACWICLLARFSCFFVCLLASLVPGGLLDLELVFIAYLSLLVAVCTILSKWFPSVAMPLCPGLYLSNWLGIAIRLPDLTVPDHISQTHNIWVCWLASITVFGPAVGAMPEAFAPGLVVWLGSVVWLAPAARLCMIAFGFLQVDYYQATY